MIKIRFAALAMAIAAAGTTSAAAQQATQASVSSVIPDGKIAVINTAVFADKIGELRQKYETVTGQFKDRSQKLQTLVTQLAAMEEDIKMKGPTLAPDKAAALKQQYDELKKQATREQEDLQADYGKQVEATTRPIRDKLSTFVTNYATQRGIVLIIDLPGASQSGALAWWSPGADITDDFIGEYNKANPVPTTGPPAPKPAAPPAGAANPKQP
jgi:Skp family chaperone for outer membrane proteins